MIAAASLDLARERAPARATAYSWLVFALCFGLLMSDYMARQVLNAVNPLLKSEWSLSNAEVASLSSVVSLAVGLLTVPLSFVADRYGRVRSLTIMALLWSAATLGGALAQNYGQMLAARFLVGVGEAAYGSVGIAVVLAVFPISMRSTLSSSFLAGSVIGQILGVIVGGQVAGVHGWRPAFAVIGLLGLILALIFPLVVRESRLSPGERHERPGVRELGRLLLGRRVLWLTYFGGGIQLFSTGALAVFLPLLLTRHYALSLVEASRLAAMLLVICAIGMVVCGILGDKVASLHPTRLPALGAGYGLASATLFAAAFALSPGTSQLLLLGAAMFIVAGITGVSGAMVANLTPRAIHSTAMGMLALSYNLFGLAPGPTVTGWLADHLGLMDALKILPLPGLLCAAAMIMALPGYSNALRSG